MVMVILQKLQLRRAALEHTTAFSEVQKSKWRELLTSPKLMSSEESGEELIDRKQIQYCTSNHFLGGKPVLQNFLKIMDEKAKTRQSKRTQRQSLPKNPGAISTRPKPTTEFGEKFWGFA